MCVVYGYMGLYVCVCACACMCRLEVDGYQMGQDQAAVVTAMCVWGGGGGRPEALWVGQGGREGRRQGRRQWGGREAGKDAGKEAGK